jgi:predicted metalloprotease
MITNEEIKKSLNKLRVIGPDPEFKKSSRTLILNYKPEKATFSGVLFLRLAGAFAVLILVIATLSLELSPTPVLSSSFNPNSLQREFENLTINVQIEEIEYHEEANQAIVSALNEIENTNVKHLNDSLLRGEAESIELDDSTNPEIDALLETVIF